jgi:hypothetical protein
VVRLSDVFIPAVYGSYTALNNLETDALVTSGILAQSDVLDAIVEGGNKEGTIPFWNDLDRTIEQNYSNDDPADLAVPHGITTGTMKYRKSYMNQSFGSMDLVKELMGQDPLQQIRNRFGNYWIGRRQRRLLATMKGILADNIANDGGDMLTDISAEVAPEDQLWNGDAFIDAAYQLGDRVNAIQALVVHSKVGARMAKNDDVETIRDSEGKILLRIYKEKVLLLDDTVPKTGTGADTVYESYLFGGGAFGFAGVEGSAFGLAEGAPADAAWVERTEQAGNGGGMEVIGERVTQILHPFGFEWVEGTLTEFSPTDADLGLAAHWNRVVSRKHVPMAVIRSKA